MKIAQLQSGGLVLKPKETMGFLEDRVMEDE
jgi:hypothetical protein